MCYGPEIILGSLTQPQGIPLNHWAMPSLSCPRMLVPRSRFLTPLTNQQHCYSSAIRQGRPTSGVSVLYSGQSTPANLAPVNVLVQTLKTSNLTIYSGRFHFPGELRVTQMCCSP